MNAIDPQRLIDEYLAWLRAKISAEKIGDAVEITTPFLDRNNDRIQIYVYPHDNGLRLTDDGYTLSDLEISGCAIDTPRRRSILETIINGLGVKVQHDKLFVDSSLNTVAAKKHALVQAILSVNDMFMTAQKHVASLFFEDVQKFLDTNEIRYTRKVSFVGATGFPHSFDFVIPHSKKSPERLVSVVNDLTKNAVTSHLFAWGDTQAARDPGAAYYVIVNDAERPADPNLIAALENYKVRTVLWTARQASLKELAV
jgi:hypothetical protein